MDRSGPGSDRSRVTAGLTRMRGVGVRNQLRMDVSRVRTVATDGVCRGSR